MPEEEQCVEVRGDLVGDRLDLLHGPTDVHGVGGGRDGVRRTRGSGRAGSPGAPRSPDPPAGPSRSRPTRDGGIGAGTGLRVANRSGAAGAAAEPMAIRARSGSVAGTGPGSTTGSDAWPDPGSSAGSGAGSGAGRPEGGTGRAPLPTGRSAAIRGRSEAGTSSDTGSGGVREENQPPPGSSSSSPEVPLADMVVGASISLPRLKHLSVDPRTSLIGSRRCPRTVPIGPRRAH